MTNSPDERRTRTLAEAAVALGVAKSTVYEAAKSGQLPTIRVGRRWLVSAAVLERMVQGGK